MSDRPIARVAVEVEPYHLDRLFDYGVGDTDPPVGARVEVVFAGRVRKGVVVERVATTDVPEGRLRDLKRVLGDHVWITEAEVGVARWVAERWGGTLADVLRHSLPGRTVDVERRAAKAGWFPTAERVAAPPAPPLSVLEERPQPAAATRRSSRRASAAPASVRPPPFASCGSTKRPPVLALR